MGCHGVVCCGGRGEDVCRMRGTEGEENEMRGEGATSRSWNV